MRGGWRNTWWGGKGKDHKEKKDILDGLNAIATKTMILAITPTHLPAEIS